MTGIFLASYQPGDRVVIDPPPGDPLECIAGEHGTVHSAYGDLFIVDVSSEQVSMGFKRYYLPASVLRLDQ